MNRIKTTLGALALGLTATVAQADLSPSQVEAIDGKSGIRVYSSDGDFIGVTNGLRINQDRTRLFLLRRAGSIFRGRGDTIVITTKTDMLTLRDGGIVLDADTRRLRVKAKTSGPGASRTVTVHILS